MGTDRYLKESITLRVRYSDNVRLTEQKAQQMLQKADFEGHGFNKEESRTVLSTGELLTNSSAYMTNLFYQRKVNCTRSQVMQVLLEEGKLLPGELFQRSGDLNLIILRSES